MIDWVLAPEMDRRMQQSMEENRLAHVNLDWQAMTVLKLTLVALIVGTCKAGQRSRQPLS